MEEPAPMGYLKKEDLEEENFIEKDDSEDENLTEKENLEDLRNKEEKEDAEFDTIEIEAEEKEDAEIDTIEIEAEEIKLVDGYAKGTEAMAKTKTKNTKLETVLEEKWHRVAEAVAKAKEILKEKELEEEKLRKKKDFEEEKRKKKGRVKKEE